MSFEIGPILDPIKKPDKSYVWLDTCLKFVKISIKDIKKDDAVYYQIPDKYHTSAYGPFRVVEVFIKEDIPKVRLRNSNGVEFNFSEERLQFLKIDLISFMNEI